MEYAIQDVPAYVTSEPAVLDSARNSIHKTLTGDGIGTTDTIQHIQRDLTTGLNRNSQSSRYYGFVTGGATPVGLIADNLVSEYDQNVQVHLPNDTIATDVEYHALKMLLELSNLDTVSWPHATFTTGCTAGNIIGLACGREYVLARRSKGEGHHRSVASLGLAKAMTLADVDDIRVLTTVPHSSLKKACSVVGLGHDSVIDVGRGGDYGHRFDHLQLEEHLSRSKTASIIAISCSEVNTGLFATDGYSEMRAIRVLADRYGAWIHCDAAFGLMARLLPDTDEYAVVKKGVEGIELVDSIAGDAHKLLNVPYDAGFFFSRHLDVGTQVFQNPGAPYLATAASSIPSPLNIGIENSRRFRALPVYANLVAYGRQGYQDMLERQIRFARRIARYMVESEHYRLLPELGGSLDAQLASIFIIVLFRAEDSRVNEDLITRINVQREIYCSGTKWQGKPAVRFAVANWKVDMKRDWPVVKHVLDKAVLT